MEYSRITRRTVFKLGLASSGAIATSTLMGMSKSAQATAAEVDVNQVQVALPKLENLANNLLQQTGVPGMAIAVVYQDQVVFLKGLGVREAGKSAAVDPAKEHFVESSKDTLSHETGEDSSRILDWI